jgi:hypothetical protein
MKHHVSFMSGLYGKLLLGGIYLRVLCGTYIGIHVAETEYPLQWTLVGAPKGIWRANLEHWKGFMHGLFGFSFLHCIHFSVESKCGERTFCVCC